MWVLYKPVNGLGWKASMTYNNINLWKKKSDIWWNNKWEFKTSVILESNFLWIKESNWCWWLNMYFSFILKMFGKWQMWYRWWNGWKINKTFKMFKLKGHKMKNVFRKSLITHVKEALFSQSWQRRLQLKCSNNTDANFPSLHTCTTHKWK